MNIFHNARYNSQAVGEGLKMVQRIIAGNRIPAHGATTAQIYRLSLQLEPSPTFPKYEAAHPSAGGQRRGKNREPPPTPPHPDHPVRSISFLKNSILPALEKTHEIRKTRMVPPDSTGTPSNAATKIWVWAPVPENERPKPVKVMPVKEVFGSEVGVGEDFSHLNKRRQRARKEKIRAAVKTLRGLNQRRIAPTAA